MSLVIFLKIKNTLNTQLLLGILMHPHIILGYCAQGEERFRTVIKISF